MEYMLEFNFSLIECYFKYFQAIKLLYVEKGKKNKSNLYFLCGNRLLSYMDKCVKREKSLISSLK